MKPNFIRYRGSEHIPTDGVSLLLSIDLYFETEALIARFKQYDDKPMINAIASNVSPKFRPGGKTAPLELILGRTCATPRGSC